jgi:FkbM family methyltransferase
MTLTGNPPVNRILRAPFRLIPDETTVPVLIGPLRGSRWVKRSINQRTMLGLYESVRLRTFARLLNPGDTVYDLGAYTGFYSICAARKVGHEGTVIAFEPFEENAALLQRNIALNNVNIRVECSAVGSWSGTARYTALAGSEGRLSDGGELTVPVTTIDQYVATHPGHAPNAIKIDVEGGEMGVLEGARATLLAASPILLIEAHSPELRRDCLALLATLGYDTTDCEGAILAT